MTGPADEAAAVPPEPGSDPGAGADPEAGAEPEVPAEPRSDLREEFEVLTEDLKGTMAGTPGQRIRILILVAVIGIVMLLAFAALRTSEAAPAASPAASIVAVVL